MILDATSSVFAFRIITGIHDIRPCLGNSTVMSLPSLATSTPTRFWAWACCDSFILRSIAADTSSGPNSAFSDDGGN